MCGCPSAGSDSNVLVQTSATAAGDEHHWLDVLTPIAPHQANVLFVSYTRTPDEWLRTLLGATDARPARLGVIHVGGTTRSAAAPETTPTTAHPDHGLRAVENPRDLTTLGITISEYLTEWEDHPQPTIICFDSVTALLRATDDLQTAFQFMHTLVGRVRSAEARAYYTITPDAHDDQGLATLRPLFDDVIDASG